MWFRNNFAAIILDLLMPAQKLLAGYGISIVRCHLTSKLLIRVLTIQY